jgi:hypothetical protein
MWHSQLEGVAPKLNSFGNVGGTNLDRLFHISYGSGNL